MIAQISLLIFISASILGKKSTNFKKWQKYTDKKPCDSHRHLAVSSYCLNFAPVKTKIISTLIVLMALISAHIALAQNTLSSDTLRVVRIEQDSALIAQQTAEIERLLYMAELQQQKDQLKKQILGEGAPTPRFNIKQAIFPVALVAVGAVAVWEPHMKQFNRYVHKNVHTDMGNVDNYLQFAPLALNLGLTIGGVKSKYSKIDNLMASVTSVAVMYALAGTMKYTIREPRPYDETERNSFPSGHVARAFRSAEMIRIQHGNWWGLSGYALASVVAYSRVAKGKHWIGDVIGGAGVGILSARIGYWLVPLERKLFRLPAHESQKIAVAAMPFYDPQSHSAGAAVAISF